MALIIRLLGFFMLGVAAGKAGVDYTSGLFWMFILGGSVIYMGTYFEQRDRN